jgi:hypothetical protein
MPRHEEGKSEPVEEIFKQYSTPIIIAVVIVALIAIVTFLLKDNGTVATAFQNLLNNFIAKAGLGG